MMNTISHFKKYTALLVCLMLGGCFAAKPYDSPLPKSKEPASSQTQEAQPETSKEKESEKTEEQKEEPEKESSDFDAYFTVSDIPEYTGQASVVINNNQPFFSDDELTVLAYEAYSSLDTLGRCTWAMASLDKTLMPTQGRESISSVKPSGWNSDKYDFIDGGNLYNRCHLIGFQLSGENANNRNLITGTRYMNVEGMLPYENRLADYIKQTGNHVLYRVTPIFDGNNLVADGVLMEAKSVEDNGEGILFNVFCYNVQPGVEIDYATGNSHALQEDPTSEAQESGSSQDVQTIPVDQQTITYIANTNTKKFHLPTCSSVSDMKEHNKKAYDGDRQELIDAGYTPCKRCNP